MKENLNDVLEREPVAPRNPEDMSALAEEVVKSVAEKNQGEDIQKIQTEIAETKKMDGFQLEKTRGEVEKMSEIEKKKQWVTRALEIMIADLKEQAGFLEGETPQQFNKRLEEGFTGIFKGFKKIASAAKIEMAEQVYSLIALKNQVTGKESVEALKVKASHLGKDAEAKLEAAYREIYPQGDYKKESNDEYQKISKRVSGAGGVTSNTWQG